MENQNKKFNNPKDILAIMYPDAKEIIREKMKDLERIPEKKIKKPEIDIQREIPKKLNEKVAASEILNDGAIAEMIFDEERNITKLVVFKDGKWEYKDNIKIDDQTILLPYPANNDLIKNKVILFPSQVEEFRSEPELVGEIQSFIHGYLDVSKFFEKIATYYVLFTWVYDNFNELPYLRALGDYGTGKTRFLQVIGSICCKPIFAGGATTTSPIFRILNDFKGTLILDEADFRWSDATSDIIKILNNGFAKGFPVLRSEGKNKFEVKAFDVFGPKIVATRQRFEDKALESRFLVEEMGEKKLREDIPLNLPNSFWKKATNIRNKLLYWRFLNYGKKCLRPELADRSLEPRVAQIILPLISIIDNEKLREELKIFIRNYNQQIISDRGMELEAQIFETILKLLAQNYALSKITVKQIADIFNVEIEDPKERISYRKVGWIIREKLKLRTERTREGYALSENNKEKIETLKRKYGIKEELLKEGEPVNDVNVKKDITNN